MRTLYLYGPPASGKTTLARKLAREFGRPAVDLDAEIVRRTGRSIPDIFVAEGEAGFRRIESETLRAVSTPIVALGGGTLLDPSNRAYAEENGFVVVLDVDDETLARRIEAAQGTRPLGNRAAERRAHYASFAHHFGADDRIVLPRPLRGRITVPVSKSHLHRLLIAEFLSGATVPPIDAADCADIAATKRCLAALPTPAARGSVTAATLDCGESGSTLRFLAPLAAALGVKATYVRRGRLAERPMIDYDGLAAGVHELRGDVSSQFVTGLLFALPLMDGDSEIRFTTPLQSRGYVDMTLDVIRAFGIRVTEAEWGFAIPGNQRYRAPATPVSPEGDWSGAAFWFAANALGSEIQVAGLAANSHQPDRVVCELIDRIREGRGPVDVSGCPDLYPALAVVDALLGKQTVFTGTERLRIKESDRLAAMEEWRRSPTDVDTKGDHRIAMAAAIAALHSDGPALIHGASCVSKSYPGFWDELHMDLYLVTGWPLVKTRSPEIHNAAYAAEGRKAEMISYPSETIEGAMAFAALADVKGMAVTIPHKLSVMSLLDEIDPAARAIGAVNTVVFREGRKYGYNTDADGFAEALLAFCGRTDLAGMSVALLGAGGAAKAVDYALRRLGAKVTTYHRRPLDGVSDIIVNATPVDPISDYAFTGRELVYDLRYVPAETPLMARARAAGCRVENGFSMLQAQARGQRRLFFG